jgi:CRISPR-associated protein Csm5
MRGIQISDSAPIPYEQLTLTGKYDRKPDGSVNLLPIFRECLVPGTEAYFTITLEIPIMKKAGIDMQSIEEALHSFADEHYANFEQYYAELPEDAAIAAREGVDLILGGGTGYVSKTLIYNLFSNRSEALPLAAKILNKQFNRHGHGRDPHMYKVAPHTLKTTMYENQYYQMGRCELIIN